MREDTMQDKMQDETWLFIGFWFCFDKVLLCSSGQPQTPYVAQASLELSVLPPPSPER